MSPLLTRRPRTVCAKCKHCDLGKLMTLRSGKAVWVCKAKPQVMLYDPVTGGDVLQNWPYCADVNHDGLCGLFEAK